MSGQVQRFLVHSVCSSLVREVNTIQTTDTSNLVKNWLCTKTTQEFNKLTADNVTARLPQANLENKNDIAEFVKKTYFDDKIKN